MVMATATGQQCLLVAGGPLMHLVPRCVSCCPQPQETVRSGRAQVIWGEYRQPDYKILRSRSHCVDQLRVHRGPSDATQGPRRGQVQSGQRSVPSPTNHARGLPLRNNTGHGEDTSCDAPLHKLSCGVKKANLAAPEANNSLQRAACLCCPRCDVVKLVSQHPLSSRRPDQHCVLGLNRRIPRCTDTAGLRSPLRSCGRQDASHHVLGQRGPRNCSPCRPWSTPGARPGPTAGCHLRGQLPRASLRLHGRSPGCRVRRREPSNCPPLIYQSSRMRKGARAFGFVIRAEESLDLLRHLHLILS
mmetsp:Transcript_129337/g.295095  ORF Transcript_129337/g.295095 Transcript_129337/m.295095 type:complete len:302 (-) Transcript_129337:285-1190(-)